MSEELLINVSPMESRVALLNEGVLREIYIERHNKMGLVGNIYVGTVVRVLPGMQAAFIDIGQSRTAFLHANDMQKIKKKKEPVKNLVLDSNVTEHTAQNNVNTSVHINVNTDDSDNIQKMIEATSHGVNTDLVNLIDPSVKETYKSNTESFFSSKQFVTKNLNNQNNLNSTVIDAAINQDNERNSLLNRQQEHITVSYDTPKLPKFGVLSTVNNVLTKESLKNSFNEQKNESGESLLGNSTETFESSSYKKQPEVNPATLIQNRLRERQLVLVQVTKDQLGTKGARLTTNISLPSRYLVYLPSSDNIGVSQRIEKDDERNRLKKELSDLMKKAELSGGLIARTAAEGVPSSKLEEDIEYLLQLWRMVQTKKEEAGSQQSPTLVYQELSLPLRSLRDLVHEGTERVVVDDASMYEQLKQFAQEFVPMMLPRIAPYHSQQPMFDVYRVEEDLRDALKRRVNLKSGGYLIIDQTEAMTTVDVNTGSFVGGRSLEDTVYKTNLEATHAIARQLRLRNLGGIIILDFIDMQEQEHKDDVLISLQTQLSTDYARTNITQVSELGLVEMTRKRTRESLEQILCEPCKTCDGKGFVKTSETVCFEIFREIMRCAKTYNSPKQFTVVAHASVIDLLLTIEADTIADLEYLIGRVINFEVETLYTQEQYDIVLD